MSENDNRDHEEAKEAQAGAGREDIAFDREELNAPDRPYTKDDELLDAFGDGSDTPIIMDPEDGLPRPADNWEAPAPSLTKDTLICIEDASAYVSVFKDEAEEVVKARSREEPSLCSLAAVLKATGRIKAASKERFRDDGAANFRETFTPSEVKIRWGLWMVGDTFVRPVRMTCKHLTRQTTIAGDIDSHGPKVQPMFTYCKAFRSMTGSFLSLMDETMTACEERSPIDQPGVERIRLRILQKIEQGKSAEKVPMVKPRGKAKEWPGDVATYDTFCWDVNCDPARAPGKISSVSVIDPIAFWILAPKVRQFAIAGNRWLPPPHLVPGNRSNQGEDGYHSLLIDPSDYAPASTDEADLATFCAAWPAHAQFAYLGEALVRLPEHLAQALLGGEDILITGADQQDAMFLAALVLRFLKQPLSIEHKNLLRPEHLAFLAR